MADAGVPWRSGPRLDGTSPGPAGQICCPGKPSGDGGREGWSGQTSLPERLVLPYVHMFVHAVLQTPWGSFPLNALPLWAFSSRPAHMLPFLSLTP